MKTILLLLFIIQISSFAQDKNPENSEIFIGLQAGCYSNYNNIFTNSGYTFTGYYEYQAINKLESGWFFVLRQVFKNNNKFEGLKGGFSLGGEVNYLFTISSIPILFRAGGGIGYPQAGAPFVLVTTLSTEAEVFKIGRIPFVLSINQELEGTFKDLPLIFSVGVKF